MTSRDFCFWLQGFFEIAGNTPAREPSNRWNLNDSQVDMIRNHLALVFKHEIDPSAGPPAHQAELNKIHETQPMPAEPWPGVFPFDRPVTQSPKFRC